MQFGIEALAYSCNELQGFAFADVQGSQARCGFALWLAESLLCLEGMTTLTQFKLRMRSAVVLSWQRGNELQLLLEA